MAAIREHRDLAERLDLIYSVSGAGMPTAVAILVRMPEIGKLSREQAAALAGLAPYDDDSGERGGARHIDGGRKRLRRALYTAALPASFRWNPHLIALYQRLIAAGKGHKRALIACARKLLIFVNTVVARGTPWQKEQPVALRNPASRLKPAFFVRPRQRSSSRPAILTTSRADAVKDGRRADLASTPCRQATP